MSRKWRRSLTSIASTVPSAGPALARSGRRVCMRVEWLHPTADAKNGTTPETVRCSTIGQRLDQEERTTVARQSVGTAVGTTPPDANTADHWPSEQQVWSLRSDSNRRPAHYETCRRNPKVSRPIPVGPNPSWSPRRTTDPLGRSGTRRDGSGPNCWASVGTAVGPKPVPRAWGDRRIARRARGEMNSTSGTGRSQGRRSRPKGSALTAIRSEPPCPDELRQELLVAASLPGSPDVCCRID